MESLEGAWCKFIVELPFNGEIIDNETIGNDLKNFTISIVSTDVKIKEQLRKSCRYYEIPYEAVDGMEQLMCSEIRCEDANSCNQTWICLVDEELYVRETYKKLRLSGKRVPFLLTFGPSFLVHETCGHYRSLTNILPSVLFRTMVDHVNQQKRSKLEECSASSTQVEHFEEAPYLNKHFLIAEDNIVNQKVLSRILRKLGIKNVEIVDNGQKAVDREAADPFDVIFMDMQMPVSKIPLRRSRTNSESAFSYKTFFFSHDRALCPPQRLWMVQKLVA